MKLSLHSTHLDIISTRKNNIIIMTHNFSFLTLFHRWWHNNQLLKGESTILNDKKVQNILHLRKLNRTDLLSSFMCHSSNNNITDPITASVMVDLNCKLNRFNTTKRECINFQFSWFWCGNLLHNTQCNHFIYFIHTSWKVKNWTGKSIFIQNAIFHFPLWWMFTSFLFHVHSFFCSFERRVSRVSIIWRLFWHGN